MASSCQDAARLLWRNPDLAKSIVACSLLVSSLTTAGPLVVTELKSRVWGENMSAYAALVAVAQGAVSMLFGGMFGRWSDQIDRRVAMGCVGLICFAQFYSLLIVGTNEAGLYVFCAWSILSGVTCMSQTGCPMIFALANDVIPANDREVAFGIAYTGTFTGAFAATIGGMLVARSHPGDPTPVLVYVGTLSLAFFLVLSTVRLPKTAGDCVEEGGGPASSFLDAEAPREAGEPEVFSAGPLRFACQVDNLRNMCMTAAMLCLPEIVLSDVTQQFVYESLGLSDEGSGKQLASILSIYPGLAAQIPLYFIAGLAAKKVGALKLLKASIPVVAVLQTLPAVIALLPSLWLVVVAAIAMSCSNVIFTPVQTVNAQIAPEGRVGEAMAAVGVFKMGSSLCANCLVFVASPAIRRAGLHDPLWVFFPMAGVISLASYAFASRIEPPTSDDTQPVYVGMGIRPTSAKDGA